MSFWANHLAACCLGLAAVARAERSESEDPRAAVSALYEAADWFRSALASRPDAEAARHNLAVALRRALVLADRIARRGVIDRFHGRRLGPMVDWSNRADNFADAGGPEGTSEERPPEVGAFYWTVLAPDIVNPGREEQGLVSA